MIYLYSTCLWGEYDNHNRFLLESYERMEEISADLQGCKVDVECTFPKSIDDSAKVQYDDEVVQYAPSSGTVLANTEEAEEVDDTPVEIPHPAHVEQAEQHDSVYGAIKFLKVEYE